MKLSNKNNIKALLFLLCFFAMELNYLKAQTVRVPFSVTQLPPPATPSISPSGSTAICQGSFVTLTSSSSSNNTWSNGATTPSIVVNSPGSYSVSVSANGCTSTSNAVSVSNSNIIITPTVNNPTCGAANGSISVSVSGGATPYTIQWSNGDFGSTADSLSAGQYVVQVTDANGCYASRVINLNSTNGPSISGQTVNNVTCPGGSNGSINITMSGGAAPLSYLWSNGATVQDLSNLSPGVYDVVITDANNCLANASFTVNDKTALGISYTIVNANCGSNNGSITAIATGGTSPYTYLWSANAGAQTTATASNLGSGIYNCTITDNLGCTFTGSTALVTVVNGPVLSYTVTPSNGCGTQSGGSISLTPSGSSSYTYLWSNGATSQNLIGLQPGAYVVVVTDANGCSSADTIEVTNDIAISDPNVCVVTVDTLTGTNKIVWEKQAGARGIQSYKLYREGSAINSYNLIATIPFNSLSEFTDPVANPQVRGWRYKISLVDSCGDETSLSAHHKTIHLAANPGLGGVVNLAWDQYEGFSYGTFYIWRYRPSSGWVKIDSLPSNLYSYTDINPPGQGNLRYFIEVKTPGDCNSTLRPAAGVINTTKSNTRDPFRLIGIREIIQVDAGLYPNPAGDVLNIVLGNLHASVIEVLDISGRVLQNIALDAHKETLQLQTCQLATGMYLVRIYTDKGVVRKPFVKD